MRLSFPVTSLPGLRVDGKIGVTLQPTEDIIEQLNAPGIMFHTQAAAKQASEIGLVALYCPKNLDYFRANGADIKMAQHVAGLVFAVLRVSGDPISSGELMPWYKDDIIVQDGNRIAVSERWPWSVQVSNVYRLVKAVPVERVIDTHKGWWVRRLYGIVEIDALAFGDAELVDCGPPGSLKPDAQGQPATPEQEAELIERSATRNGVTFEEARRSDTLYVLKSPLRPNELKVGVGIGSCEPRLIEARRWLGDGAEIVARYNATGYAASLEHIVHMQLRQRNLHSGGEWFKVSSDVVDYTVAEILLARKRKLMM